MLTNNTTHTTPRFSMAFVNNLKSNRKMANPKPPYKENKKAKQKINQAIIKTKI